MSLRTQLRTFGEELDLTGPDLLVYVKEGMAEERKELERGGGKKSKREGGRKEGERKKGKQKRKKQI